ncbi:MAG: chromosomal replication initiator protein DnaA [Clostridiales bacterium]
MDKVWQQVLELIKRDISPASYESWFAPATVSKPATITRVEKREDTVYVCVSDEWAKDTLEQIYQEQICAALLQITGEELQVIFVNLSNETLPEITTRFRKNGPVYTDVPIFNPRYTFDSFVIGSSNRFAHAAAMAVAESPSRSYNPLFIYGGSGLGKTHLMQAIGHNIIDKTPQKKVVYVSSEVFTNEFISYLGSNRIDEFKNRYRSADILLVDDIQFLANKDRIQEEFFHTFNALHDAGRQIVISSDRQPRDIHPLEERLLSRFEWGLITDIQPPDWETRCAILQRKAQTEQVNIEDDVIYYIAEKLRSNIRELEGALNKVIYSAKLNNKDIIDLLFAREALRGVMPEDEPPHLTIPIIQKIVADYYNINITDMKSRKKDRAVSYPRQIAMYLSRELLGATQPQIGRDFGGRDHTTVIHACDKISTARKIDSQLGHSLQEIENKLLGRS